MECKNLLLALSLLLSQVSYGAKITGFARSFLIGSPISHAQITVLETGEHYYTDADGKFSFDYPAGKDLTLEFKKWGYKTTQSATVVVPPEGLIGPYKNISFQIPSLETFYLFQLAIRASLDNDACHVVTTITAHNKLLSDCPQGIAGVKVRLTPDTTQKPFYFGAFDGGWLHCKTNPLSADLTSTSVDGGVGYVNLPPSDKLYRITGEKEGLRFTEARFLCRKGAFINISPPRGPNQV